MKSKFLIIPILLWSGFTYADCQGVRGYCTVRYLQNLTSQPALAGQAKNVMVDTKTITANGGTGSWNPYTTEPCKEGSTIQVPTSIIYTFGGNSCTFNLMINCDANKKYYLSGNTADCTGGLSANFVQGQTWIVK